MIEKAIKNIVLVLCVVTIQVRLPIYANQLVVAELKPSYNAEDLYWLSRVVYAESGADYCSDELQIAVASVVVNRVDSELYPNTIKEVIFDVGTWGVQYGCTINGMIYQEPNERAIENAKYVLINGSQLPSNVLGQASSNVLNYIYTTIDGVVFSAY